MKVGFHVGPLKNGHSGRGMGVYTQNLLKSLKEEGLSIQEFTDINEANDVDLIHYPFFDFFQHSLKMNKIPTVVTIPDITPLVFPEHYPSGLKGAFNLLRQRQSLKKVRSIITISEASKKDIVNYFSVDPKKVEVTYLAHNIRFNSQKNMKLMKDVKQKYKLPDSFALYPGSVNWNKNLSGMADACVESNTHFVLVGKGFENRENLNHPELKPFAQFLEKYEHHPLIHILGFVPDEELVSLYHLSSFLLFATFYEGFGLPILEAQACGTPVITSRVSSCPEVAGKGALLVDPYNTSDIVKAIKKLNDIKLKDSLIHEGYRNTERFSWTKTAQQTISIYEKVLQQTH